MKMKLRLSRRVSIYESNFFACINNIYAKPTEDNLSFSLEEFNHSSYLNWLKHLIFGQYNVLNSKNVALIRCSTVKKLLTHSIQH